MDLSSQLPLHLIHHIQNFLPTKQAARTSVLSKSWKSAWESQPRVDLNILNFKDDDNNIENFPEFATKTLARYVHQGLGVERLTIYWNVLVRYDDDHHIILASMKRWIDFVFAAGNNLKQLEILADNYGDKSGFPLNMRASNTLTSLDLCKCKFENISENVKFPSLRNLSLRDMPLNSDIIHKTFLSGSPFFESLHLVGCHGLQILEVSGLVRITRISVHNCGSLEKIGIKAPNLKYFLFSGSRGEERRHYEIKLDDCEESLRELKLARFELPIDDNYWLQTMVSRFVSLESLELCDLNNAVEIYSPSLRKLVIKNCKGFNKDTMINAPNLHSVIFNEDNDPLYSLPLSSDLSHLFLLHEKKLVSKKKRL